MLLQRFWDKVRISDTNFYKGTPCWEWIACVDIGGYGQFRLNGKTEPAHRLSYEDINGKISNGLVMNHLCRNRKCVNPDHLEDITNKENIQKGIAGFVRGLKQRLKTHCPQGHEYNQENTYNYSTRSGRKCRICGRIQCSQYKQRKKLEAK